MLHLFFSNRYETLADVLIEHLALHPGTAGPWARHQVIVPSAALRQRLQLDIAGRHGICANLEFSYLAEWLWTQISQVLRVPPRSRLAPDRLVWRCYRLLSDAADSVGEGVGHGGFDGYEPARGVTSWLVSPRLAAYLAAADAPMRYELAYRLASVFDHYLTYRPEWLLAWRDGNSIFALEGTPSQGAEAARDDEQWQAALWRALVAELAVDGEPPTHRFLRNAPALVPDANALAAWPDAVSVFALMTMPPLHVALLRELSRWIDVRIYALNPCRECWFGIVSAGRVESLDARGQLDCQQVGHPLLAEWGRQTQAQLHILHKLTETATTTNAAQYEGCVGDTWLARIQNAILDLQPEAELGPPPSERGIEVHVCHGLMRQLEVLHDRLLAAFAEDPTLAPSDVLVAVADLSAAGPLIDAVFGTAASQEAARVPYRITGLPPLQANPVARVLLDWLSLPDREVGAPELVEWLRVDAVAARYGIDVAALETVQTWLAAAGARRGLTVAAVASVSGPVDGATVPARRHTFSDALARLFLGYAMPDGAAPVGAYLPVGGPEGGEAELLGRLARFTDDLDWFVDRIAGEQTPEVWNEIFAEALARFFDSGRTHADALSGVRDALDTLVETIREGARDFSVPATVMRAGFAAGLDDPACGGVPWGGVTFSSLTSLRGLPYRMVCLVGMDDGVLPSLSRADEFDLMAVFTKFGDRQRRDDERNLFLDLLLAARDRLMITYTGRSIRDNAPLPPAALVDELLDYVAEVTAGSGAAPASIEAVRQSFIIEHPLQPFALDYFEPGGRLYSYDAERATLAGQLACGTTEDVPPFFAAPLPPEPEVPVAFGDFERFWHHPARALLRDRLGVALFETQAELSDTEPFVLDYAGSDSLAARVLPMFVENVEQGTGESVGELARRIAESSPEMPGGATGAVWREQALGALDRLASKVRLALEAGTERRTFALEITPAWPQGEIPWFGADDTALAVDALCAPLSLHGTLHRLTPAGQVIYRYARSGARNYLSAWLSHLVYCAIDPGGPRRTRWFGNEEGFEFAPVADPLAHLAPLAALFRAGRRMPLRFFPKSAWALVAEGEAKATGVWINKRVASEADDAALAIVWRGRNLSLDEPFPALARLVFAPLAQHLLIRNSRF
ncbi:MAG: exodeoxyribonuclease V subunit gamma [Burkholderia sp.]|nr:MAG: RecBCD enzyme subunit RecC [Burkholderia gladioli]